MYDRKLIDYLPNFLQEVEENHVIMTVAEEPEVNKLWDALNDAMNDQFINSATENGVSRLEKIMKIVPKANETLDSRKFTILTRATEQPPFTIKTLENQLEALCGEDNYEINRNVETKVLQVKVALVAKSNFNDVAVLLDRIVPANMVIDLTLKYNQHDAVSIYTHEDLHKNFTHEELRNGVI